MTSGLYGKYVVDSQRKLSRSHLATSLIKYETSNFFDSLTEFGIFFNGGFNSYPMTGVTIFYFDLNLYFPEG